MATKGLADMAHPAGSLFLLKSDQMFQVSGSPVCPVAASHTVALPMTGTQHIGACMVRAESGHTTYSEDLHSDLRPRQLEYMGQPLEVTLHSKEADMSLLSINIHCPLANFELVPKHGVCAQHQSRGTAPANLH